MRTHRSLCIVMLTGVSLGACIDPIGPFSFGGFGDGYGSGGSGAGGGTGQSAGMLYFQPDSVRVLRGDTVTLTATYCATYYNCDTKSNSRWSLVNGDMAVELLANGVPVMHVDSSHSVLVHAAARGVSMVRAVDLKTMVTGSARVTVADSSEITALRVFRVERGGDTVSVGANATFEVRLQNAELLEIRGAPTGWSVSDTTVLKVVGVSVAPSGFRVAVAGVVSGRADLRIRFLSVSKEVPLTVVP